MQILQTLHNDAFHFSEGGLSKDWICPLGLKVSLVAIITHTHIHTQTKTRTHCSAH